MAGEAFVRRRQHNRDPPVLWIDKGISLIDTSHVEFENRFFFANFSPTRRLEGIEILVSMDQTKASAAHSTELPSRRGD